MSSALLDEVRRVQQHPDRKPTTTANSLVKIDSKQRALVDIRTAVTPDMKQRITSLGGNDRVRIGTRRLDHRVGAAREDGTPC